MSEIDIDRLSVLSLVPGDLFLRAMKVETKGQLRRHSFAEAFINVAVGYFVALASQLAIFPLFGIYVSLRDNLAIGAFFTVVSIARSYLLRRAFNRWGSR